MKHVPSTVKEAYDSSIPGVFQADLVRYCCVLLIHGRWNAGILVEATPDRPLAPTVDRGKLVNVCLSWNDFVTAAPGSVFLVAKAIDPASTLLQHPSGFRAQGTFLSPCCPKDDSVLECTSCSRKEEG